MALQGVGEFAAKREAVRGEFAGGFDEVLPGQFAEAAVGLPHAGGRTRDADRAVADGGVLRLGEIHVLRRRGGSGFAKVDGDGLAVSQADEHEAAAAQIARGGVGDGEGERGGDGGVHGVTAFAHDVSSNRRGEPRVGYDHAVLGGERG